MLMWDSIRAVASSRFLDPIFPNLMDKLTAVPRKELRTFKRGQN